MTDLIIIAAMTHEGVIGKDNKIPWKISEDLQLFRKLTEGNTVIMGKNTYESLGKKLLRNRHNLVVSHSLKREGRDIEICRSLEEAINRSQKLEKQTFVIGGAKIYEQSIPLADKMYLSYIRKKYSGDIYFPKFNHEDWNIENVTFYRDFSFVNYKRRCF